MANALFTIGKENLLDGQFDLNTSEMRVVLVDDTDWTQNLATDNALDDIPAAGRVATSNALDSPTITGGTFDAADETLSAVTGDQSEFLVIYEHNVTETAALLLVFIDTGTNLPVTPNGGNIVISWNASGIFSL